MSSVLVLSAKTRRLAAALTLDGPGRKILERVVVAPTVKQLDAVAHSIGSGGRPFKNRPVRAEVRADIDSTRDGATINFRLSPVGVWVMGQYGAKAHKIYPKKPGGRLKASAHPHPVRGPIIHPGSRGKGAIDGAWRVVRKAQDALVPGAVDLIVQGAWHG